MRTAVCYIAMVQPDRTLRCQTQEKDKSTISRELKRNCDKRNGEYDWSLAQRKYEYRQKQKPKHIRFTNEVNELVNNWIAEDYSPEQIYGRAKIEGKECVSHERIYRKELISIMLHKNK